MDEEINLNKNQAKLKKIYQIPSADGRMKETIIGVIDCSGSMNACWKIVAKYWNNYVPKESCYTIVFDDNVKIVQNNVLLEDIH